MANNSEVTGPGPAVNSSTEFGDIRGVIAADVLGAFCLFCGLMLYTP